MKREVTICRGVEGELREMCCGVFFGDKIFYWFSRYAHAKEKMYGTQTKNITIKNVKIKKNIYINAGRHATTCTHITYICTYPNTYTHIKIG